MKKFFGVLIVLTGLTIPMACSNSPTSPAATPTPAPTATLWAGYTATNTSTPTVTATITATPTITATNLGGITSTPTATATNSPTPTITNTPTSTFTSTATNTDTNTATITNTSTPFSTSTPSLSGAPWVTAYPPNGLASNSAGTTFYVAEGDFPGPGVVQVFNQTGTAQPTTITNYNGTSFGQPNGVAVDASGNLYVLDQVNDSVYVLTSTGSPVRSWNSWTGGAVTAFSSPEGIALDSSGNVYVADTDNAMVEEFSSIGTYMAEWNSWTGGSTSNNFSIPTAIAFDGSGKIYVADAGTTLMDVFTGPGVYSNQWQTVSGSDIFGITYNSNDNNLYAADSGNSQIEIYNLNGILLTAGSGTTALNNTSPDGIAISGSNILVSDFSNNAVYQFTP